MRIVANFNSVLLMFPLSDKLFSLFMDGWGQRFREIRVCNYLHYPPIYFNPPSPPPLSDIVGFLLLHVSTVKSHDYHRASYGGWFLSTPPPPIASPNLNNDDSSYSTLHGFLPAFIVIIHL